MQEDDNGNIKRRRLLLAGLAIVVVIIFAFSLFGHHKPASTTSKTTSSESAETQYNGLNDLVNHGLLSTQEGPLEIALALFDKKQHQHTKVVGISNINHTIDTGADGTPVNTYTFALELDYVSYSAKMVLVSDYSVQLYVYNLQNPPQQLFDSGEVKSLDEEN